MWPIRLISICLNDMSNELYHYGVLGMKWGVRRNNSSSSKSSSRKIKIKPETKKKIAIGSAIAAAGLAAYGLHKVKHMPEYHLAVLEGGLKFSMSDYSLSDLKKLDLA